MYEWYLKKMEVNIMWKFKFFKTKEKMQEFLAKNEGKIQYKEVFVCNEYGIEYRKLRVL